MLKLYTTLALLTLCSIASAQSQVGVRKMVGPDGMITAVTEDDREITITENDDGITVKVKDGTGENEFKAKDAETLKAENPDAYGLYDRYCKSMEIAGPGGAMIKMAPAGGPGHMMDMPVNKKIEALLIRVTNATDAFVKAQLGEGLIVAKIISPDGRGAKAGLQANDYITTLNGSTITNIEDLTAALEKAGTSKLTFKILREAKPVTLTEP